MPNVQPFEYNGVQIDSVVYIDNGMVELTSTSGGKYVVYPEEITI